MSETWDPTYNAKPAGGEDLSTADDYIRDTRSEIYKRMITFFSNWATDPDTPASLDVKDDVVLAEHISGLTGTGAVDLTKVPGDLDDISDGSTYKKVAGISTSHQVQTSSVADANITNAKLTKTLGGFGLYSVSASGVWVIPAGWYIMSAHNGRDYLVLEIYSGTNWFGLGRVSGVVVSDGTNIRIENTDNGTAYDVAYRSLG